MRAGTRTSGDGTTASRCGWQLCRRRLAPEPALYTTGEAALLSESSFYLDQDSSVRSHPQFISAPENFHFALKAYAKDSLPDLDIRRDAAEWINFKAAFRIRNRVTNPMNEADLVVSDVDFERVRRALIWFEKVHKHTLLQCNSR